MSSEVQVKQLNAQPEAELTDRVVEKAKEAEARARRASEVAMEAASKAREAAAMSAKATKELAQEAKRKARGAQIAALKVKMEAKLVARMVKESKKTENGKATINGVTEQAEANLDKERESGPEGRVDKEGKGVKGENRKEVKLASAVKGAKTLSNELLEGRVNILLQRPNAEQVYSLEKALRVVQNLRVVLITGSTDGARKIVVQAEQPLPLVDILSRIPVVDEVTQFGWREIQLSLKK